MDIMVDIMAMVIMIIAPTETMVIEVIIIRPIVIDPPTDTTALQEITMPPSMRIIIIDPVTRFKKTTWKKETDGRVSLIINQRLHSVFSLQKHRTTQTQAYPRLDMLCRRTTVELTAAQAAKYTAIANAADDRRERLKAEKERLLAQTLDPQTQLIQTQGWRYWMLEACVVSVIKQKILGSTLERQ